MDDNYQRKVSMFMRAAVRLVAMLVSALMPLVAQIHLLSPSAGQVLFPGRLVRIEWDNATQGPVDVLYSTDRGRSWVTIASAVSVHGIEWTVPLLDTVPISIKVQATAILPPSQFGSVTVPDSVRSAWWVGTTKTVASLSIGGFVCFSNDEQRFDRRCLPIGIEDAKLLCLYPNAPDSVIVARGSELMVISSERVLLLLPLRAIRPRILSRSLHILNCRLLLPAMLMDTFAFGILQLDR